MYGTVSWYLLEPGTEVFRDKISEAHFGGPLDRARQADGSEQGGWHVGFITLLGLL